MRFLAAVLAHGIASTLGGEPIVPAGLAPAALLAVLHNASTVATCLWRLRPLLPPGEYGPPLALEPD